MDDQIIKLIPPDAAEEKPSVDEVLALKRLKGRIRFWLMVNGALLLLVAPAIYFAYRSSFAVSEDRLGNDQVARDQPVASEEKKEMAARLLDGVMVEKGAENKPVFGVMIDNHPDARPPAGLDKAQLVIEAEAEGGLSRYLAFFGAGEALEKIGPVRSARPYFIDWSREFSAVYAHVGGSPDALAKMSKERTPHLNEFYDGEYFWRDEAGRAPHNVYTSSANLEKAAAAKSFKPGGFFPRNYKDEAALSERPEAAAEIRIAYGGGQAVAWKYDRLANNYVRYLSGSIHVSQGGEAVKAKNIAIEQVSAQVLDDKLRLKIETSGKGGAVVCSDGVCRKGEWRKPSQAGRARFYQENGEEFALNRGTTWIEVVSQGVETQY